MSAYKLTPTEQIAITRKAILSLKLTPDTKPEATKRELADFSKQVQRMLISKPHLKPLKLVLVEVAEEKGK